MTDFPGLLATASASTRVVLSGCMRSCHTWLGSPPFHASTAAIAFHAVCPTVSAHTRGVAIAIIRGCMLDTAIATDQAVISVVPAVRTAVSPGVAVSVRLYSGRMLHATVAAN